MDTNQNLGSLLNNDNSGSPVGGNKTSLGLGDLLQDKPLQSRRTSRPVDSAELDRIAQEEGAGHLSHVAQAIFGQESGGNPNSATSIDGARGGMQIMPATFKMYAKPGERIDNPADNLRVGVRIVKDLGAKSGDDPAKIAVGYFSGEGNINKGDGAAWRQDHRDGNGKQVSGYVSDVLARLGNAPKQQPQKEADFSGVPKWDDLIKKPEFAKASPELLAETKQLYFDHYIAPRVGKDAADLRAAFMAKKDVMPTPPEGTGSAFNMQGEGVSDPMGSGASEIMAAGGTAQSAMQRAPSTLEELPTTSKVPVLPKVREDFQRAWDSATPEQRQAMQAQNGWTGQLARERAGVFARADANNVQAGKVLDPRAEFRAARMMDKGEAPEFALRAGVTGAMAGALPGQEPKTVGQIAQGSTYDFDTKNAFDPNANGKNGLNNELTRGIAKGVLGTGKAAAGYMQFLGDVTGMDAAAGVFKDAGQVMRAKEDAIGERSKDEFGRTLEGAINSITQQLPLMLGGVKLASQAIPLAGMAVQSFGQEYSDGRAKGQTTAQAATRASLFAAFEVVGGKFGLGERMEAMKIAARGMPSDEIAKLLWASLKKEVPGEVLTTSGQFATDKFAGMGVGLNPDATFDDYLKQVADTIKQTLMQSVLMGAGTTGVSKAVRYLKDNGKSDGVAMADAELAKAQALNKWDGLSAAGQVDKNSTPPVAVEPEVTEDGRIEPTMEAMAGAPVAAEPPQANAIHPTVQTADDIVKSLAEEHGVPLDTVLPAAPQQAQDTNEQVSDQDVMDLAGSRFEQLRTKRDGIEGENEGMPLSPAEQNELNALVAARGDTLALRQFYGFTQEQQDATNQGQAQEPGPSPSQDTTGSDGQPSGSTTLTQPAGFTEAPTADQQYPVGDTGQQVGPIETPDPLTVPLAERSDDELRAQLRAANDRGIQRVIADELARRKQEAEDKAPAPEPVKPPAPPKTEKARNQQADYSSKWFATKDKAVAFVDKKRIGDTHEAVREEGRYVIKKKGPKDPMAPATSNFHVDPVTQSHSVFNQSKDSNGTQAPQAQQATQEGPQAPAAGAVDGQANTPVPEAAAPTDGGLPDAGRAGAVEADGVSNVYDFTKKLDEKLQDDATDKAIRQEVTSQLAELTALGNQKRVTNGDLARLTQIEYESSDLWNASRGLHKLLKEIKSRKSGDIETAQQGNITVKDAANDDPVKPKTEKEARAKRESSVAPTVEKNAMLNLDAMFDDVLAEEVAKDKPKTERQVKDTAEGGVTKAIENVKRLLRETRNKIETEPAQTADRKAQLKQRELDLEKEIRVLRQQAIGEMDVAPRTATAAAVSAAKNTAEGLTNAIDGLGALFGGKPGQLNSGLAFDEETYAKAKPLFQAAIANLGDAGKDMKEAMRAVVRMVLDKFGAGVAQNMKPYVVHFISEVQNQPTAQDNQEPDNASPVQTESVPPGSPSQDPENASTGDGHSEPLVTGVAKDGAGSDQVGGVPASTGEPGGTGADRTESGRDESPVKLGESGSDGTVTKPTNANDDHVIDAEDIGKGGLAKKYKDNITAIKILKTLDTEGRVATPDERKALAKYVGWGAMKGAFDAHNKAWTKQHAELKELLTDAEFKAAKASTLDAHYTSPIAVGAMYDAMARLGFKGGRVLEPSVGSGNFFGMMPRDMRNASHLFGVELDSLTAKLAQALYPKAKIAHSGFEDFDIPAEYFDAVVGNPPFGRQPVVDKERSAYSGFHVHNYFLAKAIDKLRPGGIMQVVVSHNFMDAVDNRTRKWIGERAVLIGGVRMPDTTFKENAGTEVVTDILIFQKNDPNATQVDNLSPWQAVVDQVNTNPKTGESVKHKVNEFFAKNTDMVLGTPTAGGSMYAANQYTVTANGDLKAQLGNWVKSLPEGVFDHIDRKADSAVVDMAVPDGVKVGSFYVDSTGKVMQRGADVMGNKTANDYDPMQEVEDRARDGGYKTEKAINNARGRARTAILRMKGMIALRDLLRQQMRLERSLDSTTDAIEANRAEMNAQYDAFLKEFGHLNSTTNRGLFMDDTESQLLQALEFDYDKGIGKATADKEGIDKKDASAVKADIFKRRVAFPPQDFLTVSTAKDALLASLNYRGKVDAAYMESVYNKPMGEIVKELGDVVFDDPQAGIVPSDEYLSGDVKTKLEEAKAAAQDDAKYKRNVQALEAVIPKDKKPSEISVGIGASFVPAALYQQFVKEITGASATAHYMKATGQWLLDFNGQPDPALNVGKYGTEELDARQLFQLSMLGKGAVVKQTFRNPDGSTTTVVLEKETEAARAKQNAIKDEWKKWIWADAARANQVATIYNDTMNRLVDRKFDGLHLTFPGMNPGITLLNHQKNGVWRGLQSYQVLYDHVVGAGKTFEMATLAMEMRRLGISRKPLFVVPNHLTLQWRSEFTRLYPGSNILAATPEDFAKDKRERMFSKIITGDWDAVVIGHSSLKKIGLPEETERAVLQEQIDEISQAIEDMKRTRGDRNITRDMEVIKKNLEAKMKEKMAAIGKRSKVVTFDELGVDAMFVDEMHEFKNLTYNSTMDRNPGMGNPAGSGKAFDMFVKTRWLFDTFGQKTPFISATGTPVSNSLVEMYNMQRYMQYPTLKAKGLHVFDAWAKQFGSVESVYEVAPSGSGYRQSSRFAKFTNLPGLMSLYNSFADTVTLDDLKAQEESLGKRFPVPKLVGGRPVLVVAKRSPAVAARMGVPKAETNEDGSIKFEADLSQEVSFTQDEKTQKWTAKVGDTVIGATFDTEQDAKLKVVEKALTPKVSVDPESILGRFANLRQLTKQSKGKVNALSLTGEANKMGLDYRLIDPHAADFPGSKINLAVNNMMDVYRKWAADKGAQLVFCDMSIPLSARASYGSKERRLYVRGENGVVEMKRGTMHAATGHEDMPFFLVPTGEKESKVFNIYDAASGAFITPGGKTKAAAIEKATEIINDQAKRAKWLTHSEATGGIDKDAIDEYNNENDVDTVEIAFFGPEDIAGMSGSAQFSVYDDIKAKLVAKGVPEREVAFIHDYDTPTAKDKLFKQVNAGEVRFLLGSTPKMGAGTNVQSLLVGLHHIDAPWRPSDLEQREGRIIRRGNKLYERDPDGFEVFIGRYATEQTYDTRRWQILEHKARGIEQLRNFDGTINEIDDIDGEAANSADMKAAASGDPLILEETKLRNEVRRLEQLQASHADEVLAMNRRAADAKDYADKYGPAKLKELGDMIATTAKHKLDKDGWAPVRVDGQLFDEKEAAAKAITDTTSIVRAGLAEHVLIRYRGVEFEALLRFGNLYAESPTGSIGAWGPSEAFSASGFIQRMKNYIDRLPAIQDEVKDRVKKAEHDAVALVDQSKQPFAQSKDLDKAREDYKGVQRALMSKGPAVPEAQKPLVAKGMESQKAALKAAGFGEALSEFMGGENRTVNEPIDQYNVDPYANTTQRPGTTDSQRATGRDALSELVGRIKGFDTPGRGQNAGVIQGTVLGNRLYANFVAGKTNSLVGQVAKTPADLATIAQVYRDPRFETFRVVYMDGNKVVGEAGYSSRLPAMVSIPNDLEDQMRKDKQRFGADGYYIIHNHPSGSAAASKEDINLTKSVAGQVAGMRAHVVIDHNEFGVIDQRGNTMVVKDKTLNGVDFSTHPKLEHKLLGEEANSPAKIAHIAKTLQIPSGHATLLLNDVDSRIKLIVDLPMAALLDSSNHGVLKGKSLIRSMARDTGSGGVRAIVLPEGANIKDFAHWVTSGTVTDVVSADGQSLRQHELVAHPGDFLMEYTPARKAYEKEGDGYQIPSAITSLQNKAIQFFGSKPIGTFNKYDRYVATQYHKAMKDKHYGKVYSLLLGQQNHVSLASIRAAELAPGVLRHVADMKSAVKELARFGDDPQLAKASEAVFAGTTDGESVMQGRVWTEDELRKKFNLDDTGIALYKQSREAIDASLDEVASAEAYNMASSILPKAARATVIDDPQGADAYIQDEIKKQIRMLDAAIRGAKKLGALDQEAELKTTKAGYVDTLRKVEAIFTMAKNLKAAGYAPLMRFGKFDVTVKAVDPVTGAAIRDENGDTQILHYERFETNREARDFEAKMKARYAGRKDVGIAIGHHSTKQNEQYKGVNPETMEIFADAIGGRRAADEYIRLVKSDRSALKRRLERKGTAGYSENLSRVLSSFITSNARHASQLLYGAAINRSIQYIPFQKGDVKDEAIALRDFVLNPDDNGSTLSSIMFAWFLGGSPAAAMVNMTQPAMMTFPYLSQFARPDTAAAELAKAVPYAMGKKEIQDGELRVALKKAGREGVVDAQEIFHLYSMGSGNLATSNKGQAAMTLWGSMFSAVEGLNRRLTFIAAWNIAKQRKEKDPYAFAIRSVNQTQGIYNKVNRPNMARSWQGRMLFMYKTYGIMYMELVTRMWKSGPEGKRAVGIMMAVLVLAAGEEGLPGAKALDDLIDTIGQLMGYATNARRWKRRQAYELLGTEFGNMALYGASSMLPLDFGGRLGLGSIIPATGVVKKSNSASGYTQALAEVVGPTAGAAKQITDAFEAASDGEWGQAARNLAPKAVRDVANAAAWSKLGYATDVRGNRVTDIKPSDVAVKAIGFNPTVVAETTRRTMPSQQDISLVKKVEAGIVHKRASGFAHNDQKEIDKANEALVEWNTKNPGFEIKVQNSQIKGAAKKMLMEKEDRIMKSAPKETRRTLGLDLAK